MDLSTVLDLHDPWTLLAIAGTAAATLASLFGLACLVLLWSLGRQVGKLARALREPPVSAAQLGLHGLDPAMAAMLRPQRLAK